MKLAFEIPCSTSNLKDLRRFVSKVLSSTSLDETNQNAIVLAVDEVCANIIIHSKCKKSQHIKLNIDVEKDHLMFEIRDQGKYHFNINEYQGPDLDEIIETRRKGGVGILLVKKIMDKIEMLSENGTNICRLYKTL